jgi:hypothetical protein
LFIIGLVYALDKTIIFELLLNVSIRLKNPDTVLKFDPPYTLIFILLLILSYASGLILSFLGDLLGRKCYNRQYRKMLRDFPAIHKWLRELAELKKESPKKDKGCDILFQRQHDYVKQEYAHQARSLSQAEAEGQLCIITSAAYIILCLIQTIKLIIEKEFLQRLTSPIIFLVIAIISFIAALYRNKRFLMRQFSYSAEIKRREDDAKKRGRTFKIVR